jgi:putative protease
VKNHFECGQNFELMTPRGNLRFTLDAMEKQTGTAIKVAPGSGHIVKIPRPEAAATGQDYGLLVRDIT